MFIDKYFYTQFKRNNPTEHYHLVLDKLDELSRRFVSALEFADFLQQKINEIDDAKTKK